MRDQGMSGKNILTGLVLLLSVFIAELDCRAAKFEYEGYEVEVFWKVRGKNLNVWGDIEKGKRCKQLNVYVHLRNNRYHSRASIDTSVRKEHFPKGRSIFSGQSKIRDNGYKDGWFVDRLSVTCSNLNPIN
jgi:hypothetical protein